MRRLGVWFRNCHKYNLASIDPLPMCRAGRAHGAVTMPFSKHVVDPRHIKAMRLAFQKVCDALHLECGPDDPQTDRIVLKIIELTKAGEVDPGRICARVLIELTKQPGSGGK